MLDIRRMRQPDTGYAKMLTDIEQWGHLQIDFGRLLRLDPEGCFVAWQDGLRVGIATTARYGGYAFVGNVIVEKEYRGSVIGPALMEHAVNYLDEKNIATIELDGVLSAVAMYRHMGFQDKYLSLRFVRNPTEKALHSNAVPPCEASVEEMVDFDHRKTTIHRERLIGEMLRDNPGRAFCLRTPDLRAYTVVRDRANGACAIGPLVAEDPNACDSMISAVTSSFVGRPLAIGVPEINNAAVSIMRQYGFYQCRFATSIRSDNSNEIVLMD